jgi:hypothetical protein
MSEKPSEVSSAGSVRKRIMSWVCTHWKPLLGVGVAASALGAFAAISIVDAISMPTAAQASCSGTTVPAHRVGSAGPGQGMLAAKLQEGQREEVDFGRSIAAKELKMYLDLGGLASGQRYFSVHANQFVRADGAILNKSFIAADAESDGNLLILNLCFIRERNHTSIGDPGMYTGTVTLDDSRLRSSVTVPVTVTMQYVHGSLLFSIFFLLTLIPGTWCLWVVKTNRKGADNALSKSFFSWPFTVQGIVAVVVAGIAAIGVYIATYLRDPTWGSSVLQPLSLYGGMFTAFVTTGGIAQLAGKE